MGGRGYRLEDDLLKKSRPKWNSKRWKRLQEALGGNRVGIWCEKCGRHLFNPQSILIHQGGHCQKQFSNQLKFKNMPGTQEDAQSAEPVGNTDSVSELKTQRELTFGEKLVGLNFNPSNDDAVGKAKRLCADLADLLNQDYNNGNEHTGLKAQLYNHAIGEILNAQMNVVKVLTLKY